MMANRGQKRTEIVNELPADKRACSSLEFRPNLSSALTPTTSINHDHDHDMDTYSSASGSSRSDEDKDSTYGSCDSDEMGDAEQRQNRLALYDYQRQRSSGDQAKLKRILSNLNDEIGESDQLAALTELCEILSFCTGSSISSLAADSLSPVLVKFARHESNPDIMLLAIRALTYLCDIHPRWSSFVVRLDGVSALCERLLAIEYLDVAEQCLQALEKISREQPLPCLWSGAIMAVLTYIDFFSTSLQRVALSTVVNICEKLPSQGTKHFMDAVPILCNLLRYEDKQLVENVATCLIKIAERVHQSPDMLDELCKYGLIHQVTHLLNSSSRTTLCQSVHTGLIGLLVKLAAGSMPAIRTLFELNISSILKDILLNYDLSHGMLSPRMVDGHCNQVHEVLTLLNQLLPVIAINQDDLLATDKEAFLVNHPDHLRKFGNDLLSALIQVVNSGVDLYVCFGCLSVIDKLVYYSNADMLCDLLKSTDISSFLAGVLSRKDCHVLMLALHIVDTILQKNSDVFLGPFIKEGVLFAIDALLVPDKCLQFMFSMFNDVELSNSLSQKSASRDVFRCLCYSLHASESPSTSEPRTCKLEKDCVQTKAKHIRTNYFDRGSSTSENGFTDILQKLKTLSAELADLMNMFKGDGDGDGDASLHEEECYLILRRIMSYLNGEDVISTFEFVESGISESLVNYLTNDKCLHWKSGSRGTKNQSFFIEKRLEAFGRLFLSSMPSDQAFDNFSLSAFISKLQNALSSVENFPVVLNNTSKHRNSYATVPYRRCTAYPCLKVLFVRGEGETNLSDYSEDVQNVDPLSDFDAIEGFLWPKVCSNSSKEENSATKVLDENFPTRSPYNPVPMKSAYVSHHVHGLQGENHSLRQHVPVATSSNLEPISGESTSRKEAQVDSVEKEQHDSVQEDDCMSTESPKLLFYLEGEQMDRALTIYQAILRRHHKAEYDTITRAALWSQVYRVTYRKASKVKGSNSKLYEDQFCFSAVEEATSYRQFSPPFSHMFVSEINSAVEKSAPSHSILFLLRILEAMNRFRFHLMSRERIHAYAEGGINDLDGIKVADAGILMNGFVNNRLTEKLEQQMLDPLAVSTGGMPSWCMQLMASCPFLFSFEARCKYFRLASLGKHHGQPQASSPSNSGSTISRQQNNVPLPRKKLLVYRHRILESAAKMMDLHASQKVVLEVEYDEEVGTGLGPTVEFYTLVSNEFQKPGLGLWRGDVMSVETLQNKDFMISSPFGLFPRPWCPPITASSGIEFSEVLKRFSLLGQVVAKAIHDGRVMDLPFSKAFYKLILGQELTMYDIQSFDPGLGKTLIEFEALVQRRKHLESDGEKSTIDLGPSFHNMKVEDLHLDFTIPGYPDYTLGSGPDQEMVNTTSLEAYVEFVVDATINSGISRQVEAFRSGFNQVFAISGLQIFSEEELECLLCGEREVWNSNELSDHIKFDHGYTASSPPILHLLEIMQELDCEQQKAFLKFVTGAPRLPLGGLASLNPKLTIVRKHCGELVDADLPSVMTCANYLKLPPYSSKETMKEKLLYAITEGQGSFHLS